MYGIYIHIPFCKQACSYCDFHFSTNQKLQTDLTSALCAEIESRQNELTTDLDTIYFGGGSPSILTNTNLSLIFTALRGSFDLSKVREITLESNPDDHSAAQLDFWRSLGINRLSIGIQSFIERDLTLMNRAHTAAEAGDCVVNAKRAGFEKLTIDLIYGIPNQSLAEWEENIRRAIDLNTDHISAYYLTIEDKTALSHQIKKGDLIEKSDEDIEAEYLLLCKLLAAAGFDHYEISNFAKPGKAALHNSAYWSGAAYVGIGPSAHSFDGHNVRRWNVSNNAVYTRAMHQNNPNVESEMLSEMERFNERLMTLLRTKKGFNYSSESKKLQVALEKNMHELSKSDSALIVCHNRNIHIPETNWLFTDRIIRALILA
jgi:oxygen-independent coproporphyrinogen III oxidase